MKLLAHITGTALALGLAAPALAGTPSGTITITATAPTKCSVVTGGSGSSFSGSITLGALNASDGTLLANLEGTATPAAQQAAFQIKCNGSDATVSLSANRFSTGSGTAPTGYSRNIDYTAELDAALAVGGPAVFKYTTAAVLPAATSGNLGARLANTGSNNVTISVYSFGAENGVSSILEAGSYTSTINVSITPVT
jgi:hypothetical protein